MQAATAETEKIMAKKAAEETARVNAANAKKRATTSNDVNEGTGKVPNANTKVVNAPEVKVPNAIKSLDATGAWDNYLGKNTTNIKTVRKKLCK